MLTVCHNIGYVGYVVACLIAIQIPLYAQQKPSHVASDIEWSQEMVHAKPFLVDSSALRIASPLELNQLGQWSDVLNWPHTPVSAANLPDGRILTFASNDEVAWPAGQREFTYAAAWDPITGSFKMVPHNTHDMFCAELVLTDTGKLHVAGGRNSVPTTSTFDFQTDSWVEAGDMETGRWYPTSVSLPNGTVFTALGSGGTPGFGPTPEMWDAGSGWRTMGGIDMSFPIIYQDGWDSSSWPFLFIAPNGELFHAGPTNRMHYINLADQGAMRSVGTSDKGWYGKRGANVMYEENKIMIIGGSRHHPEEVKNVGTDQVLAIDISGRSPVLRPLPSMNYARITHNALLLPNGEILVVGGQTEGTGDDNSILTPELFNPETNEWIELADMSVPRNYHSTALLMTDGRVWSGGGGFCTTECPAITHSDAQVFSPPYLFDENGNPAVRPVIDTAPPTVLNGDSFVVDATAGVTRFTWIKMSAITHQMNTDLRRLYAEFTESSPGVYEISAHPNPNVLTPGYWMLFAVDQQGVPSEAAVIQVETSDLPTLQQPGLQFGVEGEIVSLYVDAFDNDPLVFSASGLPPGLGINEHTGEVSGIIPENASGTYNVSISVSDGVNQSSVSFSWTVGTSKGEVGVLDNVVLDWSDWNTVQLEESYTAPVVIMGPPSGDGASPLLLRVQNVSSGQFDFRIETWGSGDANLEDGTVSFMVLESGVHYLPDGRMIQAGFTSVSSDVKQVNFNAPFNTTPIVLSQIGTLNEDQSAIARIQNVTENGFEIYLQEEAAQSDGHIEEIVYWIALEQGVAGNEADLEAGSHPILENQEVVTLDLTGSFSAESPVFTAIQSSADPSATSLFIEQRTTSSIDVRVDTEQPNGEVQPGEVGYLVFASEGPFPFKPNDIPPILLANPGNQVGTEGQVVYRLIHVEQDNGNPLTFSATGLPNGVTIDETNGLISGGLVPGNEGLASVTVYATDGISEGAVSFDWIIYGASGEWLDYRNDSQQAVQLSTVASDDNEEKDIAAGDLNRDGWDDVIVVRKEPFMEQGARTDLLLLNENGVLVDRTASLAPGFQSNPTIARDVLIEDFDRDGWLDVVIANTFGDQPVYYRNLGEAEGVWLGLVEESEERLPHLEVGSLQHCAVTSGDVNGDGYLDLYFANYVLDGVVEDVLFINDGTGAFTNEGADRLGDLIQVGFGTQATIVDIDFDGDNDIIKLSAKQPVDPYGSDGIFVLYNDGTGHYSDWSTVPSSQAYMYAMADFNNDTEYDFYIVDDALDYVQLSDQVIPNADIQFTRETMPWVRTAGHGANVHVADLDRDGDLDIGVADVDTSFPPCESDGFRAFLLLENKDSASGSFRDPYGAADKPWNRNIYDFAFIDINNDGNKDIFMADCAGYSVFTSTLDPVDDAEKQAVIELGDLKFGVAAHDQREGTGYIMYSSENVHTRFSVTPHSQWNADHLIAVVEENGQWSYDYNNFTLVPFTPIPSDHLVAKVDFGNNTAVPLAGIDSTISGIAAGYISGDFSIIPEYWNGEEDAGEFWVTGTRLILVNDIAPENTAPVLEAMSDLEHTVGDTVAVSLAAADSDGNALQFFAAGLPSGLTLDDMEIAGVLTQADTFNVIIGVSDGQGGADSTQFVWIVQQAPSGTGTEQNTRRPTAFSMESIYPNPSNGSTTIAYQLPEESSVLIEVYAITGRRIRVLEDVPMKSPGLWHFTWDGSDGDGRPLATGLYLIRFKAGNYTQTGKVIMVR